MEKLACGGSLEVMEQWLEFRMSYNDIFFLILILYSVIFPNTLLALLSVSF